MTRQRSPRKIDPDHLAFVRQLPCVVCGNDIETEAAHIRAACVKAAKRPTGKGERPDDAWTLPLCGRCHRDQHERGETSFWSYHQVDPFFIALALYRVSGDMEAGAQIVTHSRS